MSRKSSKRPAAGGQRRSLLLALAGLVIFVFAVFAPSLHSEFVYDSTEEIENWDFIHDPGNLLVPLTFRLMSLDVLDFNRPVAVTSLMFDSLVWGRAPFGYHFTNILLHVITTCLAFLLIRHILTFGDSRDRTALAFLAMLVFAVHPTVTEAVCEPANRKDLLAAVFGLIALLLAVRHRSGFGPGDPSRLLLIPFLCLLAIGSKEVGAAYPAILVLYWFLFRRREPGRFWAIAIAASFFTTVSFLIARFALEHHPSLIFRHAPTYPGGGTFANTILIVQPRVLGLYVINLLWPANLCADYGPYSLHYLPWALALVMLAVIIAPIAWWASRDRRVFFATGFVVACLLPVCNFVPIFHPIADRYLYNPLIGLALLVAIALDHQWLVAKPSRQAMAAAVVLIIVAAWLPLTLQREKVWSSRLALWQDTVQRNPFSFSARIGLPEALLLDGRPAEAKTWSDKSLQTWYVHYPWIWFDEAIELNRLGDRAGAQQAAQRAVALQSDIGDADKMAGTLQARRDFAVEFSQIAASAPPQNSSNAPQK